MLIVVDNFEASMLYLLSLFAPCNNGQWLMDLIDTMDTMDYRPLPLTIVHGVHGVD